MKHILISREYPPAPGGGIGTYVFNIARLFAENGETVHVITQHWKGAEKSLEEKYSGRLIIHRIPFEDWTSLLRRKPNPLIKSKEAKALFQSDFYPQSFAWQTSRLAEKLISQEGIDIIEGQDFEAPLYYLQLRRALGLDPKRRPPFIVHLHTPTEFVAQYNDWDMASPSVATAKRLEDYSIKAADVLLCPSRFFASQAEIHYGLAKDSIWIIPHPLGEDFFVHRGEEVWEKGTICYLGRLERRKGVVEWIRAAIAVLCEYPTARFDFIGANALESDTISGEDFVRRLIPRELIKSFRFRGQQRHSSLSKFLAKARIAVVPSRWENFPFACIEAMSSGLPVIASREGGMVEMIEDGRTGWLANHQGIEGLAEALRRALGTPPSQIAKMGRNAAQDIRRICENKKSVEKHLEFRKRIIKQGAKRSLSLPENLPWKNKPVFHPSAKRAVLRSSGEGIAIVLTGFNNGLALERCLRGLEQQTRKPVAVVVVNGGFTGEQTQSVMNRMSQNGWQVIQKIDGGLASTKNAGIKAVVSAGINPLAFAFLSAEDLLFPNFVAMCESVLLHCSQVGLVSCWTQNFGSETSVSTRPCPSFPCQWLSNEATSFSAIRTEALLHAGSFRPNLSQGFEDWDLFNAVMAAGWVAVTIPEILGGHHVKQRSITHIETNHAHSRMLPLLIERFPDQIAHDAKDIALLAGSLAVRISGKNSFTLKEHIEFLYMTFRHPGMTAKAALWALTNLRKRLAKRYFS